MAQSDDVNLDDLRRRARRRLVGAIVLALSAAVFVPMLLESEPKPLGEDLSVRIPPVDSGKFVNKLGAKDGADGAKAPAAKADASRTEAAKAEAARAESAKAEAARAERALTDTGSAVGSAAPAAAAPSGTAPSSAAPKRSLAEAEQRVLNAPAKAPTAAPTAKAEAPKSEAPKAESAKSDAPKSEATTSDAPKSNASASAADSPGFAVQLAAFSDDKGANALANKLKKVGYPAYTETVTNNTGTLWRVRVGPYPSREAAGASRDKLKGDGYSGIVSPAK